MSEAPIARTPQSHSSSLARAFLLVLGAIAFLLLAAPQAASALDLGGDPVGGAVDQVARPVGGAVDRVARPVGGAVDRVLDDVEQAANQLKQQVDGVQVQFNEPVGDLLGGSPPTDQDPGYAPNRHPTQLPTSEVPAAPPKRLPDFAREAPSPASGPFLAEHASLSQSAGAFDTSVPAGTPPVPVGPSSAWMGGTGEPGGRGLPLNAAVLAAALVLVVAMSRWLRHLFDARAPNPFLSRLEVPG
jgi:hypothetical protein